MVNRLFTLIIIIVCLVLNPPNILKDAIDNIFPKQGLTDTRTQNNNNVDSITVEYSRSEFQCEPSDSFSAPSLDREKLSFEVREVVRHSIDEGAEVATLDFVANAIGLPTHLSRYEYMLAQDYPFLKRYPYDTVPLFGDGHWLSRINRDSLKLTLGLKPLSSAEIEAMVQNDKINNQTIFVTDDHKITLLAFMHLNMPNFSQELAEQIIAAGYEPTLSDLAYFTQVNLDLEFLRYLVSQSSVDVTKVHTFLPSFESLASIALSAGNFDTLMYWISLNSPINPEPLGYSAFTKFLLAIKNKLYSREEEKAIFKLIAEAPLSADDILMVNTFSTLYLNKAVEHKEYKPQAFLNDTQMQLFSSAVQNIKSLVFELTQQEQSQNECDNALVKHVINESFSTLIHERVEHKKEMDEVEQNMNISLARVQYFKQLLNQKDDFEQIQNEKLISKGKALRAQFDASKNNDKLASLHQVIALAQAGKWSLALDKLEQMNMVDSEAYDMLLSIALVTESASEAAIVELIELGGHLPKNAYLLLVSRGESELIDKLLPYGLNITEPVQLGGDVIKDVITYGSPEMLKVFLYHGVKPNMTIKGKDALDLLLSKFTLEGSEPAFLQQLMELGLNIEDSHLAYTYELAQNSVPEFKYIKRTYSELVNFEAEN